MFASADTDYPAELRRMGLVEQPVVFAANELVIAVPAGGDISAIADLAEPGRKIVIGDPSVPVGSYTREVLQRLPATEREGILANVRSEEPEVSSIVAKLGNGAADAGFVYVTDVRAAGGRTARDPDSGDPTAQSGLCGRGGEGKRSAGPRAALSRRAAEWSRGHGSAPRRIPAAAMIRRGWFGLAASLATVLTLFFLLVPILAIFTNASPGRLLDALGEESARDALWLSLRTSVTAIAIITVVGTPVAYLLAMRSFRGRAAVLTLIELPLVVPPAVAGIALLAAFGPQGIAGSLVADAGIELVFQTAGVVVALIFVAAPFFLRQAISAFAAVDRRQLEVSRTLGAGAFRTFITVAVPVARPGLSSGLALAWGRALGEFGATLMFAGSLQGVTQTAPLAIFAEFSEPDGFAGALALSAVLIVVSAALLISVKLIGGERSIEGGGRP